MSIFQFATGPKRSMGHVLGAEKGNFLIRGRGRPTVYGGRTSGILSIRGPEVSLRSPRVLTRRGQSPTPHARALSASDTSAYMHLWPNTYVTKCQGFGSRALWRAPSTGACGVGDYPTPDLSRRESASRSAPEKSVQFGPDGAPFPSKTSITRGPPVVAVAVSLDPILPHR